MFVTVYSLLFKGLRIDASCLENWSVGQFIDGAGDGSLRYHLFFNRNVHIKHV